MIVRTPRGDPRNPTQWEDVMFEAGRHRSRLAAIRITNWQTQFLREVLTACQFKSQHIRVATNDTVKQS